MTGWRIGYSHANKKITDKMVKIQQHILTNVPLFIQKAALKALISKSNHLKKFNNLLYRNHSYAFKILKKIIFFILKNLMVVFLFFYKLKKKFYQMYFVPIY